MQARPERLAKPKTEAELVQTICSTRKLRAVGAGHSFMPLCETDATLLSLADLEGRVEIAADRRTVWAPAGWSLDRLTSALWAEGLSLINQGDVNPQSLAGATATGTHGTGAELGSLSTQACGFRLAMADGQIVECGPDLRPELYQAQRLSLGLFGVAVAIRIHVVPAYHLEERIERRPLAEMVERWDELASSTRHMEFFVFPYSDDVIFKSLHPAEAEPGFVDGNDIDEAAFGSVLGVGKAIPALIPSLQKLMMWTQGKGTRRVGPAYRIFPSERAIRFEEMEYELPRANGIDTLKEAIAYIRRKRMPIAFPLEFRLVAGDDIWMSPFNVGPGASISLHQYSKMPWKAAFNELEAVFRAGEGRPHWAKRHTLGPDDVRRLYPKTEDYLRVRAETDPEGKFLNAPLEALFGL